METPEMEYFFINNVIGFPLILKDITFYIND